MLMTQLDTYASKQLSIRFRFCKIKALVLHIRESVAESASLAGKHNHVLHAKAIPNNLLL